MLEWISVKDKLPIQLPAFEEVSKQMLINSEIIMRKISNHVDKEIERFKSEMDKIKEKENE